MKRLGTKNNDILEVKVIPFNTKILAAMKNIDDICYEGGFEVDIDWYIEAYNKVSEMVVAVDKDNNIVGYCGVIGLRPEIYNCYKLGLLKGDASLSKNAYLSLEEADCLYLSMIALMPEYRGIGIGREMYLKSMDNMKKYNADVIAYCNDISRKLFKEFNEITVINNNHYIMEYKHS